MRKYDGEMVSEHFCSDAGGNTYRIRRVVPVRRGVLGTAVLLDDNDMTVNRISRGVYSVASADGGEIEVICNDPSAP